jgi:hypothetical protein
LCDLNTFQLSQTETAPRNFSAPVKFDGIGVLHDRQWEYIGKSTQGIVNARTENGAGKW